MCEASRPTVFYYTTLAPNIPQLFTVPSLIEFSHACVQHESWLSWFWRFQTAHFPAPFLWKSSMKNLCSFVVALNPLGVFNSISQLLLNGNCCFASTVNCLSAVLGFSKNVGIMFGCICVLTYTGQDVHLVNNLKVATTEWNRAQWCEI